MRYIVLIFLIAFISCNAASENEVVNEQAEATTAASSDKATEDIINQNTVIPEAIMGGPADFTVTIKGVQPGSANLIGFYAERHFKADSSSFDNKGSIRFKKEEGYPQGMYYIALPQNQFVQIILGEDQKFTMNCEQINIVRTMEVKGSEENEQMYKTLQFEAQFNPQYRHINESLDKLQEGSADYNAMKREKKKKEEERERFLDDLYKKHSDLLYTNFKQAGQNPKVRETGTDQEKIYHFRQEFWDNVNFEDRRLLRTPVIVNKLKRYMLELTPQNPDSVFASAKYLVDKTLAYPEYFKFFANWITLQFEPTKCTLMDPEAVFVNMARNYFTRDRAFWSDSMEVYAIQNRAMEMGQSLVGQKGPNVISTNPDGEQKALYDINSDYIIVYMFNPTCEHCMEQTPKLVQWHKEWKSKGVEVFAIGLDTNHEEWTDYIKKNGMERFTNVYDPTNRSIYAKYYVDITPELYVLNPDRTIIGKNLKVNQIETIINRDRG